MADYRDGTLVLDLHGGRVDARAVAGREMEVDRDAAAPYICHYEGGTGRHVKDGVRIAVGEYNGALIVALPGPNDEVRASLEPLARGLKAGADKAVLAEAIAERLRSVLRERSGLPPASPLHLAPPSRGKAS